MVSCAFITMKMYSVINDGNEDDDSDNYNATMWKINCKRDESRRWADRSIVIKRFLFAAQRDAWKMWSSFPFFTGLFITTDLPSHATFRAYSYKTDVASRFRTRSRVRNRTIKRNPPALFYKASRSYVEMYRGYDTRSRTGVRIDDRIENRVLARNPTRVKITASRSSFPWRDKGKKGSVSPLCIFMVRSPAATYDSHAMRRRRSCIRATCNNAIVRATGNNWTIYEPRGLALRMYNYRGKRCVAHNCEPACDAPPDPAIIRLSPPVITHAATVFPSHGWLWKSRWEFRRRTISARHPRSFYPRRAVLARRRLR